jgi:hypothetical protein
MSELAQTVADAVESVAGTRWPIVDAHANVPHVLGLYAVYGTHSAWADLKLTECDVATGALPLRAVEAEVVKRLDPSLNIEYLGRTPGRN